MVSYENSIVINASRSEVFAYANEPATLPDWLVGMFEVREVIGTGAGQQYEWTFKMAGVQLRGQNVVVDYIADECATHQGIGMMSSSWTNLVEPHEDGAKLTIKVEYSIPVPVLGKLAERLIVSRNERALQSSLLNLKETLEG
jgi:carbon monoxide dehydrogenase subunit G